MLETPPTLQRLLSCFGVETHKVYGVWLLGKPRREIRLPSALHGPVLSLAFWRLASICRIDVIAASLQRLLQAAQEQYSSVA